MRSVVGSRLVRSNGYWHRCWLIGEGEQVIVGNKIHTGEAAPIEIEGGGSFQPYVPSNMVLSPEGERGVVDVLFICDPQPSLTLTPDALIETDEVLGAGRQRYAVVAVDKWGGSDGGHWQLKLRRL